MKKIMKSLFPVALAAIAWIPAMGNQENAPASFKVKGVASENSVNATQYKEADQDGPITVQPAGTVTSYTRDAFTYVVMGGMAFANPDVSGAADVVDGEDGFVYISHPYASLVTNSWLKGKRDGDRIVVTLPQLIYREVTDGETYDYYAYKMELKGATDDPDKWYYPTESQELVYYCDENGFHMEGTDDGTFLFGLCDSEGGWTGHGDMSQTYIEFSPENAMPPSGVAISDWQFTSGGTGHAITYAEDNSTVFVKGFAKDFPERWIKGERDNDGVFFPSGQYLGVDPATQHHNFIYGGGKETYWNEIYEMELTRNILADNIRFSGPTDSLSITGNVLVNKGTVSYNPLVTYSDITLRKTPAEIVPYPANPQLTTLIEYNENWGYGAFIFNLPSLNMDGYILPSENMYYMIYVDGEPWPLYADEYPGIEDETYLIPYWYDDGAFIRGYGVSHTFYYFSSDIDTLGVQNIYEKDGEYFGSQVVYYDLTLTGVNTITPEEKAIDRIEWYDISGKRLDNPGNGMNIKVIIYEDGSVKTEKILGHVKESDK